MTPQSSLLADFLHQTSFDHHRLDPDPATSPVTARLLSAKPSSTVEPQPNQINDHLKLVVPQHVIFGTGHNQMSWLQQLFDLSDSTLLCARLMHKVELSFAINPKDERELHEIPRARALVQLITKHWPYWLHFCEPNPSFMAMLCLCLCEVSPERSQTRQNITGQFFVSSHELVLRLRHLMRAAATLQAGHDLAAPLRLHHKRKLATSIRQMLVQNEAPKNDSPTN